MSDIDLNRVQKRHAQFVALMPEFPGWESPLYGEWLDLYLKLCKVAVSIDRFERDVATSKEPARDHGDRWPCHERPRAEWCDRDGPGGFMGHTCVAAAVDPGFGSQTAEKTSPFEIIAAPRQSGFVDDSIRHLGHAVDALNVGEEGAAFEVPCICGWEGDRAGWAKHKDEVLAADCAKTPLAREALAIVEDLVKRPAAPPAGAPAVKWAHELRDARRKLIIAALERAPRPLRRSDLIDKLPQIPAGSMFSYLSGMVEAGLIVRHDNGTYGLPMPKATPKPAQVEPAPAPAAAPVNEAPEVGSTKGLTTIQRSLLGKIKADYEQGRQAVWNELAKAAGVRPAGLTFVLVALEDLKLIVRDQHGIRPFGTKPLPGTVAPKPPDAEPAPAVKSKAEIEQEMIDRHIREKGVSRAAEESPTLDDILAEFKKAGRKVKANDLGSLFELGGKKMWRDGILAEANKLRILRGEPVWDSRKVRWPRPDGTTEGEPMKDIA